MEDINESIAIARGAKPAPPPKMPTALDCMTHNVISFRPDQAIHEVVQVLISKGISGGPVLDRERNLVGMISELDCLRATAASLYEKRYCSSDRLVQDEMSTEVTTVEPSADVYSMVHLFETKSIRRLPVVEDGAVIGQVSRRDILKAIEKFW